jgi:hypothetical protein
VNAVAEAQMNFSFSWVDDDNAEVLAHENPPVRVGWLGWCEGLWIFSQLDSSETERQEVTISVDPAAETEFSEDRVRIAKEEGGVQAALNREFESRLQLFRDDTRLLAILGAKIEARKWYADGFHYNPAPQEDPPHVDFPPKTGLWMRNYKAMKDVNLSAAYAQIRDQTGDAYRRILDHGGSVAEHFAMTEALMLERGLLAGVGDQEVYERLQSGKTRLQVAHDLGISISAVMRAHDRWKAAIKP